MMAGRGFREQLEADLDEVFFNLEEFAETHVINGKEVPVIIDNDKLAELNMGREIRTEQLFTDEIMFYVRKADLEFEPVPDQYLEFDGRVCIVTGVKDDGGTYTVAVEERRH